METESTLSLSSLSGLLLMVVVLSSLQTHVHGDERRPADAEPNNYEHDARRIPPRPEDTRGIPSAHQILTNAQHSIVALYMYIQEPCQHVHTDPIIIGPILPSGTHVRNTPRYLFLHPTTKLYTTSFHRDGRLGFRLLILRQVEGRLGFRLPIMKVG